MSCYGILDEAVSRAGLQNSARAEAKTHAVATNDAPSPDAGRLRL